ncbi:MAG TPA: enolase C-terminal domain-like protein [Acidobacteriaceae bacterium]|jgi:L-fuconate dehydratase|nr:enolase C-terminal domain-like protein [Acidobacteriaceae bacterium]
MSKKLVTIQTIHSYDARYTLDAGAGSDAVHLNSEYCLAVTLLKTDNALMGTGIVLTLGEGNRIVCELIDLLAPALIGKDIEELMSEFGKFSKELANHSQLRWLGPHKGAIHLALASIVNACFDLWAKAREVPLWRLLLDLSPEAVVNLLDLSYMEDALSRNDCLNILKENYLTREQREPLLQAGYPGYDTSVGWLRYDDEKLRKNIVHAIDAGFRAFKMKVGSQNPERDIRRAHLLREIAGNQSLLMFDANQQWSYPQAVEMCQALRNMSPYWIEEPTHPDDIIAHRRLIEAIAPLRIAIGEHIPNRVMFKNFIEAKAIHFVQVDCTRVAGVSEFIVISLMARKFHLPVVPHVGDMGQIHQHLVIFNHIAMGHSIEFLEYIPHLQRYFSNPVRIINGFYMIPGEPGASTDLIIHKLKENLVRT